MEHKRSNATGKLRNLKDFLVWNKNFRKGSGSKRNSSQDNMETPSQDNKVGQDESQEFSSQRRRSSQTTNQNSVSLFDLVDPPMSSSRPTSMALSVHLNIHAMQDSTLQNGTRNGSNIGKSVSMHGLSSNDCRPTSSSAIAKKAQHQSSNPAIKLFNTIKSKLGIKKKEHQHNKIVDTSKSDFGSYFSSPSSTSKTPIRSDSSILQCDNLILSSSRSQDNILSPNAIESDNRLEADTRSSAPGARGLNLSSTSAVSSPQIDCLDANDSSSALHDSRHHFHSRSSSQNESQGAMNSSADSKPPIPLKQRTLKKDASSAGHLDACQRDTAPATPLKGSLTKELCDLLHYGWYWGGMSKDEAEEKLKGEPDGAFVVRDSSSHHYLLSLSFNSHGKTLHTRIEYRNGKFCFYSSEMESFGTVAELIDYWVTNSEQGTFCYSRSRHRSAGNIPSYPVVLSKPVSRFTEVKSLAHLSRFVIRQYTRLDLIPQLPLPQSLIEYVGQQKYI